MTTKPSVVQNLADTSAVLDDLREAARQLLAVFNLLRSDLALRSRARLQAVLDTADETRVRIIAQENAV